MSIKTSGREIIERIDGEIPQIKAENHIDFYHGMGYMHAYDRGMQLIFMKILGRGQGSEFLDPSADMLEIDSFFRRMNWHNNIQEELDKLSKIETEYLNSYCDGINAAFQKRKPWELKLLLGYKDFNWTPEDTVLLIRMTGYLTLAQSQGEMERFFIQLVRFGVSKELLAELYPDILDDFNPEIIGEIKLSNQIVPESVKWFLATAPMMASNNWVISGSKTKSGKPILANDPHLEINRLPCVWYEVSGIIGNSFVHGATMPGIPSVIIGRNEHLSWGVTYSFMDAIDSWVEKCHQEKYLKNGIFNEFSKRIEIIKRKKKPDHIITFYENEHGTLEGDPKEQGDGYYLATKWTGEKSGANTLKAGFELSNAKTVEEGMGKAELIEAAFSWVFADTKNNIGYQMSGLMPKRNNSKGFSPALGWSDNVDWKGFIDPQKLPRSLNPEEGYIITANNDLNHLAVEKPINMPMGPYRANRIKELIEGQEKTDSEFSKTIQYDVYSIQARQFMGIILPLLNTTSEHSIILKNWGFCYDKDSKGAYIFELIYWMLHLEVFGKTFDETFLNYTEDSTGIFIDFFQNFDDILLSKESKWFQGRSQNEIYMCALDRAFKTPIKTWSEVNQITLKHILLGDNLPGFLGFNKGPFFLPGGRATIHQGQIYKSAGRKTSFGPSFRLVTDMANRTVFTNYIGGVSDRRFSSLYNNEFENWRDGVFKEFVY